MLNLTAIAALFHLICFLVEIFYSQNPITQAFLLQFRTGTNLLDRPSGLMSEPSYYGAFAATFGLPLFILNRRVVVRIIAASIIGTAIYISAKTAIPVFTCQFIYHMMLNRNRKFIFFEIQNIKTSIKNRKNELLLLGAVVGTAFVILINSTNVFEIEKNLSSLNRFGSSLLALNAIFAGYGVTGVGFGQFHFLYTNQFAPNFLQLSDEARQQLLGVSTSRASTYNFYLRLILETGFLGLIFFLSIIRRLYHIVRSSNADAATVIGGHFVAGSLGFYFTQDPYILPSFVFGTALIISSRKR